MQLSQQVIEELNKQSKINEDDTTSTSSIGLKIKNNQYELSRVLFIRNVHNKIHPSELVSIFYETTNCLQNINKILILKEKSQAFIEFEDIKGSQFILENIKHTPLFLKGLELKISSSPRQEIKSKHAISIDQLLLSNNTKFEQSNLIYADIINCKQDVTVDNLYVLFNMHGFIKKIIINKRSSDRYCAFIEMYDKNSVTNSIKNLHGRCMQTNCNQLNVQNTQISSISQNNPNLVIKDYDNKKFIDSSLLKRKLLNEEHKIKKQDYYSTDKSPVVILSNVPIDTNCTELFNIFSCVGNIIRIKIMFQNRTNALIEQLDHAAALRAKELFNNIPFKNSRIKVNVSKSGQVKQASETSDLTREFQNTSLNRFNNYANYKNICPPNNILHICNIEEGVEQGLLNNILDEQKGLEDFKWMKNTSNRMALVKYNDIENATKILATCHNTEINGREIKISFSKQSF